MYTTLREIIDEITVIRNDEGDSNRERYAVLAKQALRKFNLTLGFNVASKYVTIENGRAKLPADFIAETKVALCVNGWHLMLNATGNLCTGNKDASFCEQVADDTVANDDRARLNYDIDSLISGSLPYYYRTTDTFDFANVWQGGQYVGGVIGYGAGYPSAGFYRIHNGVIYVSDDIPNGAEVIIEYKSTGIDGDSALVPYTSMDLILAWIDYDSEKRKWPATKAAIFRRDYQDAIRACQAAVKGCTLTDWVRASRKSKRMGVNR